MNEPPDSPTDTSSEALFTALYERLKRLASRQLGHGMRGTLDTTALVHEAFLRVNHDQALSFEHQGQFFAYAASAMRCVLADRARARMRYKAGGEWIKVTLTGDRVADTALASAAEALALEEALSRLEQDDERAARVVELRYFVGLSHGQIADILGVGQRTVERDWRYARAFLRSALG